MCPMEDILDNDFFLQFEYMYTTPYLVTSPMRTPNII